MDRASLASIARSYSAVSHSYAWPSLFAVGQTLNIFTIMANLMPKISLLLLLILGTSVPVVVQGQQTSDPCLEEGKKSMVLKWQEKFLSWDHCSYLPDWADTWHESAKYLDTANCSKSDSIEELNLMLARLRFSSFQLGDSLQKLSRVEVLPPKVVMGGCVDTIHIVRKITRNQQLVRMDTVDIDYDKNVQCPGRSRVKIVYWNECNDCATSSKKLKLQPMVGFGSLYRGAQFQEAGFYADLSLRVPIPETKTAFVPGIRLSLLSTWTDLGIGDNAGTDWDRRQTFGNLQIPLLWETRVAKSKKGNSALFIVAGPVFETFVPISHDFRDGSVFEESHKVGGGFEIAVRAQLGENFSLRLSAQGLAPYNTSFAQGSEQGRLSTPYQGRNGGGITRIADGVVQLGFVWSL